MLKFFNVDNLVRKFNSLIDSKATENSALFSDYMINLLKQAFSLFLNYYNPNSSNLEKLVTYAENKIIFDNGDNKNHWRFVINKEDNDKIFVVKYYLDNDKKSENNGQFIKEIQRYPQDRYNKEYNSLKVTGNINDTYPR